MPYQPPYKHTDREMLEAEIADLEADIASSSIHDGTPRMDVYRQECRERLSKLKAALEQPESSWRFKYGMLVI